MQESKITISVAREVDEDVGCQRVRSGCRLPESNIRLSVALRVSRYPLDPVPLVSQEQEELLERLNAALGAKKIDKSTYDKARSKIEVRSSPCRAGAGAGAGCPLLWVRVNAHVDVSFDE